MTDPHQSDNRLLDFKPGEQQTVQFELDGETVIIRQEWSHDDVLARLQLTFSLKMPQRFAVRVFIPDDSLNACAALNGHFLLGWFAADPRPDIPELVISHCAEDGHSVTPLRPGYWQTINFRWQTDDRLVVYLVRGPQDEA